MNEQQLGNVALLLQVRGPVPQTNACDLSAVRQHRQLLAGVHRQTLLTLKLTDPQKGLSEEQKHLTVCITAAGIIKADLVICLSSRHIICFV